MGCLKGVYMDMKSFNGSLFGGFGHRGWISSAMLVGLALIVSACGKDSSEISGVVNPAYSTITPTTAGLSDNVVFSLNGSDMPTSGYTATIGSSTCATTTRVNANLVQTICSTPSTGSTATITFKRNDTTLLSSTVALLPPTYVSPSVTNVALASTATFAITGQRIPTARYFATLGTTSCDATQSSSTLINVSCATPATGTSSTLTLKDMSGTTTIATFPITFFAKSSIASVNPAIVEREKTFAFAVSGANFSVNKVYSISISGSEIFKTSNCPQPVVYASTLTTTCKVPNVDNEETKANLTVTEDGVSLGNLTLTINKSAGVLSSLASVSPNSVPQGSVRTYTITGTNFIVGDTNYGVQLNGVDCTSVSVGTVTTTLSATCVAPSAGTTADMVIYKDNATNANHQLGTISVALTATANIASVSPLVAVPNQAGVKFTFTGNNLEEGTNLYNVKLGDNICTNVSVASKTSITAECTTPTTTSTFYPTFSITKKSNGATIDGTGADGVVKLYLSTITKITASPKMFTVYRNPADRPSHSATEVKITVEATGGLSSSTTINSSPACPNWRLVSSSGVKNVYACTPVSTPSDAQTPIFYTFQDGVQGVTAKVATTADAGFTKVNDRGEALSIQTGVYNTSAADITAAVLTGTYWYCVRDNKHNLIWKINNEELIFSSTYKANVASHLQTLKAINRIPEEKSVCGKTSVDLASPDADAYRWRFPTWFEMNNYLVNIQKSPAIDDITYFPNINHSGNADNANTNSYWSYGEKYTSTSLYNSETEFDITLNASNYKNFCSFDLSKGVVEPVYSSDTATATSTPTNAEIPSWCGISGDGTGRTPADLLLPAMFIRYGE